MDDFIGATGETVNAGSLQAGLAMQAQAQIDGMLARHFGTIPEMVDVSGDRESLAEDSYNASGH